MLGSEPVLTPGRDLLPAPARQRSGGGDRAGRRVRQGKIAGRVLRRGGDPGAGAGAGRQRQRDPAGRAAGDGQGGLRQDPRKPVRRFGDRRGSDARGRPGARRSTASSSPASPDATSSTKRRRCCLPACCAREATPLTYFRPNSPAALGGHRVALREATVICLSLVSTSSAARARHIVRRLRRRASRARIVLGFWGHAPRNLARRRAGRHRGRRGGDHPRRSAGRYRGAVDGCGAAIATPRPIRVRRAPRLRRAGRAPAQPLRVARKRSRT